MIRFPFLSESQKRREVCSGSKMIFASLGTSLCWTRLGKHKLELQRIIKLKPGLSLQAPLGRRLLVWFGIWNFSNWRRRHQSQSQKQPRQAKQKCPHHDNIEFNHARPKLTMMQVLLFQHVCLTVVFALSLELQRSDNFFWRFADYVVCCVPWQKPGPTLSWTRSPLAVTKSGFRYLQTFNGKIQDTTWKEQPGTKRLSTNKTRQIKQRNMFVICV